MVWPLGAERFCHRVKHTYATNFRFRTLEAPVGEVEEAWRRAIDLLPDEPRFRDEKAKMLATRR